MSDDTRTTHKDVCVHWTDSTLCQHTAHFHCCSDSCEFCRLLPVWELWRSHWMAGLSLWKRSHTIPDDVAAAARGCTGSPQDKGVICFMEKMSEKSLKSTGFTVGRESRRHGREASSPGNIRNDAVQQWILDSAAPDTHWVCKGFQGFPAERGEGYCSVHTVHQNPTVTNNEILIYCVYGSLGCSSEMQSYDMRIWMNSCL